MPPRPHRGLRAALVPRLVGLARSVPAPLSLRPALRAAAGAVPGWRSRVERSMAAALGPQGYRPEHVRAYFAHLADLLAYAMLVYRSGVHNPRLGRELLPDPASARHYEEALAHGKGALMVGPHLIGHEVMVGIATQTAPVAVLVRKSPDPEYQAIKERWYAALGVEVVYRPQRNDAMGGLGEMTAALRVLRKNHVLALTPDLLQKPGKGIPVHLFGRQAELPPGPFFLAVRTGAPILASFFHKEGDCYRLWTHAPLYLSAGQDRDLAIAGAAQRWATLFEEFVSAHPDMWQFWLDKRWSRWLDERERACGSSST